MGLGRGTVALPSILNYRVLVCFVRVRLFLLLFVCCVFIQTFVTKLQVATI